MKVEMYIRANCNIEYISNLCKDSYYYNKNHQIVFFFSSSNLILIPKNGFNVKFIFQLNYYC